VSGIDVLSPKSTATRLLQLQTASATASHGEKQEPDIEVGTWGSDEKTGGRRAWGSLPRCARGAVRLAQVWNNIPYPGYEIIYIYIYIYIYIERERE
jgi:hypothetical protein